MSALMFFDFDNIESWGPELTEVSINVVGAATLNALRVSKHEFIEDAGAELLSCGGKQVVSNFVEGWLRSCTITAYHGTRVDKKSLQSIMQDGLVPLVADQRRERLTRALKCHERWTEIESSLSEALVAHGEGNRAGCRIGQVHATISRSGLMRSFNHYLQYGAEFDWHVAHYLLGKDGQELLKQDGQSYLITIHVPGDLAIEACNPWRTLAGDDLPNLVREVVDMWAYWLSKPSYNSADRQLDCGLIFKSAIPPEWIKSAELLKG